MSKPYSLDLRERVVKAVEETGLSRRKAAAHFGIGVRTAIEWVHRHRQTGSVAPRKIGGYKPKKIAGAHRDWLVARCREKDFTLRGLVEELAERGLAVDYRSVWGLRPSRETELQKKPCTRPNRTGPTWRAGEGSGENIRAGLIRPGWFSSMRPGSRPTWPPCGDGPRAAKG